MAKRIAGWLFLVPLSLLLILFALANRHLVPVNFNPFLPVGEATVGAGVPLFLVIYLMLLIGVLLGGVATWLAQSRIRAERRHWRREAAQLSRELDGLRKTPEPQSRQALLEIDDFLDRA